MSLPEMHKALVLSSFKDPMDLVLKDIPVPAVSPGSVIVKVLSTSVLSYARAVYNGSIPYPMTLPLTPGGAGSIGRVVAAGPDAVALQPGQLVIVDINVVARDDPGSNILQGLFGMGPAEKLMAGEWRNGSFAEYAKVPLENAFPLNEEVLTKDLGYTIHDLCYAFPLLVPFGGLAEVDVKPGQSVIVAPATGAFGGAAVTIALALGARVIAAGRNEAQLKAMASVLGPAYQARLSVVRLVCDVEADAAALQKATPGGKGADVYIDFSPAVAAKSTHIKSCLMALKTFGRAAFQGGIQDEVGIPYGLVMLKSLRIQGRFMFDRSVVARLVGMLEAGIVKLGDAAGVKVMGPYGLDKINDALEAAEQYNGWGNLVVVAPGA